MLVPTIPAPARIRCIRIYSAILKRRNTHLLLGLSGADRRHTYHALMAVFWMSGNPSSRRSSR